MTPCELTAGITALANTIACNLNDEEITLPASVLVQLGDTLVTVVALRGACDKTDVDK